MLLIIESNPLVSFVVACRRRGPELHETLKRISLCGLAPDQFELLLVDGRSGGPDRADVLRTTCGRYLVFLRENTYPCAGAMSRMFDFFESEPALGAAVFSATSLDGSRRAASPGMVWARGTALRRGALERSGPVPGDWDTPECEFDLSLRLLAAGWQIRSCDGLDVTELPPALPPPSGRAALRHDVAMVAKYFPRRWVAPYAIDIAARRRLADGSPLALRLDLLRGLGRGLSRRQPMGPALFESLVRPQDIERRLRRAQDRWRLHRILLLDLGPNFLAYRRAARACGIEVAAVAALGGRDRLHHGLPVLSDEEALRLPFDAAVVANIAPVQAARRRDEWRQFDRRPVIDLFEDDALAIRPYAAPLRLPTCDPPQPLASASEVRRTVARSA